MMSAETTAKHGGAVSVREYLNDRELLLTAGVHPDDAGYCILEAIAHAAARPKTDDPVALNRPDYRPLNDGLWGSDEARTEHMLRLEEAVGPWWEAADEADRLAWAERVVIATVNRIIAELPGLPDAVRTQCRDARTIAEAAEAAARADWAAEEGPDARATSPSAMASIDWAATWAAAMAATWAAAEHVLILAVDIWIEAIPAGEE